MASTIPRLYVSSAFAAGGDCELSAGQAHYLKDVLRRQPGETVLLFNGSQGEWEAQIATLTSKRATLTLASLRREQRDAADLWLCFAPVKSQGTDFIVEKATELGVRVLQPVLTARTIARRVNAERLLANAIEAAEQTERTDIPEVREPQTLETLLADWPHDRTLLFCDESREGRPLPEVLGEVSTAGFALLTGPEGGFTPEERAMIRRLPDARGVDLGPRILRAETAALAGLACFQALRGDWYSPNLNACGQKAAFQ